MSRIRLGLIFGGRSSEHEVSLRSARAVYDALDREKYEPILIGIGTDGRWQLHSETDFLRLTASSSGRLPAHSAAGSLAPNPGASGLVRLDGNEHPNLKLDVVFPVLHGPYGEDGTVQGLLELADLPYVGSGVLGSAIGMDKDVQKRLLKQSGLPVVEYVALRAREWARDRDEVRRRAGALPLPLFVKPASLGSSVGVAKVHKPSELDAAVEAALVFDEKVLIERGVDAREIECSALGDHDSPEISLLGEVCPSDEFYSYEAKYVNEHGASFIIPAPLSPELTAQIRDLAASAFRAIECDGMARVDFFLERGTDRVFINELNTIPGFTSISQYPKLWEVSGVSYRKLLDRLITLAIERHQRRGRLRTSYRAGT